MTALFIRIAAPLAFAVSAASLSCECFAQSRETPKAAVDSKISNPSGGDASAQRPTAPLSESELQSKALLSAIEKILKRAADEREAVKASPAKDHFLFPLLWTQTKEDREKAVRELLDSALEVVTDAPIVQFQQEIASHREQIAALKARAAELREKRLEAPESGFVPSLFTETRESIDKAIAKIHDDIAVHEAEIQRLKQTIAAALSKAGITLSQEQNDLLLSSVLGGDLLKLVTAFEVAKATDQRLAILVNQSNEDLAAARRYFAMHAALFALLVHAQEMLIDKIDNVYLAKLSRILDGLAATRSQTRDLLATQTRDDQHRILEANLKSQDLSEKVALFYRDYLNNQRRILMESRQKTLFDLRIADNTYETVEASFQLKTLMDEAKTSFDALQKLQTPGFDQIFRNDNLKREFENLTQKLAPSS